MLGVSRSLAIALIRIRRSQRWLLVAVAA